MSRYHMCSHPDWARRKDGRCAGCGEIIKPQNTTPKPAVPGHKCKCDHHAETCQCVGIGVPRDPSILLDNRPVLRGWKGR